jgi:2,3-bisphosphoglycerate-dependent phosphoglycerate mutase
MRIYFVRHGQSEANILREISNRGWRHGLTEKGRAQATALGEALRGANATYIYTSPLKRAVETAQILSTSLDIPYETTDALREFDCGIAEGHTEAWAWDLHRWVWDEWIHNRPDSCIEGGGESQTALLNRFVPFVNGLVAEKKDTTESLVLIGHGGLYWAVLPRLLVLPDFNAIDGLEFDNTSYVLAEARPEGLVCLEWCGKFISV